MFVQGQIYLRRELHQKYGGQRQGGISTPSAYPFVMLFTGQQGADYGYHDGWTNDNTFLYTGEGQVGDMTFVRGNRAIRDHIAEHKDIHLFEYVQPGSVRYLGQMICSGYNYRQAPDMNNNPRTVIVFELVPISAFPADTLV
jgi:5-methylcytosine-specific restriction protein A